MSQITFKNIPEMQIGCLNTLIREYITELEWGGRSSVDYVMQSMRIGLQNNTAVVMVDDVYNPKTFFWGIAQQSATVNERIFAVVMMFTTKEARGDKDRVVSLISSMEQVGRLMACKRIYGGSWELIDSSASKMWLKSNYVEQEKFFTKLL